MEGTSRSWLLASASAAAGLTSWGTLLLPPSGAMAHLAENLAWGLVVGALVLALLAFDALHARLPRTLAALGVLAAVLRGASLFLFP